MNLYPVNLNINDRLCLVVGGGEVAGRKIKGLLSCGAKVIVISPQICPALTEFVEQGKVEWYARSYRKGDLKEAFLAFAATDKRDVQQQVIDEATENGIPINAVDAPVSCSFQVPAIVRRERFLITVSTGGGSPAFAARIRKDLENEYGFEYGRLVELLFSIREEIVSDGRCSESHKTLFEKLLKLNILAHIRSENWSALQDELCTLLPEDIDVGKLVSALLNVYRVKFE